MIDFVLSFCARERFALFTGFLLVPREPCQRAVRFSESYGGRARALRLMVIEFICMIIAYCAFGYLLRRYRDAVFVNGFCARDENYVCSVRE